MREARCPTPPPTRALVLLISWDCAAGKAQWLCSSFCTAEDTSACEGHKDESDRIGLMLPFETSGPGGV
jgi:hypothetical protein